MANADTDLENRHALVTGGGSGVGAAIALGLAQAGAKVTISGRGREALDAVAQQHVNIHVALGDVTDPQSVAAMFAQASDRHGSVDIAIANAGAAHSKPFGAMKLSDLNESLAVNLGGVFNTWHEALGPMKKAGWGRMIAIGSTAGLKGYSYVSTYCAAKHGVVGLTKSLASELAQTGITVNVICPGFTQTPMLERSIQNIVDKTGLSADAARQSLQRSNPQNRFIQADEIAACVFWLVSDAAGSINGQAISVSGGET